MSSKEIKELKKLEDAVKFYKDRAKKAERELTKEEDMFVKRSEARILVLKKEIGTPLTEQQQTRFDRYGSSFEFLKKSDYADDDFDMYDEELDYINKTPIELAKIIDTLKKEEKNADELSVKYMETDQTKSRYYFKQQQLLQIHILELRQLQAIKLTQIEIARYEGDPRHERLVYDLKKTLQKEISGEILYLPQGRVDLTPKAPISNPAESGPSGVSLLVEQANKSPKLKAPPVRKRVVEKPVEEPVEEPVKKPKLKPSPVLKIGKSVNVKQIEADKATFGVHDGENEFIWLNDPRYNGKDLFLLTTAEGVLAMQEISDKSKRTYITNPDTAKPYKYQPSDATEIQYNYKYGYLRDKDIVKKGLLGQKGYDIKDKYVIPYKDKIDIVKIDDPNELFDETLKVDDVALEMNVEEVTPDMTLEEAIFNEDPTKFLSIPEKKILTDEDNKYEWKSVAYSNTTPVYVRLGEYKTQGIGFPFDYHIPPQYLTIRTFNDFYPDPSEDEFDWDEEGNEVPVLDWYFSERMYKLYKKYLKRKRLESAGIQKSESNKPFLINRIKLVENEEGEEEIDKTIGDVFITTTAKGALEVEMVKKDIYIPYRVIVGPPIVITTPQIDNFYIQLRDILFRNDEKVYYAFAYVAGEVTYNLKSPYAFKALTFKATTELFIRLGYRPKKEGITFYIKKTDIITEEVDSPTNPNPYEDTELSDDFLKYKSQRDKYIQRQRVKDSKDIRITGEQSGYEGVISERTSLESELVSYLVEPKKSKKDKPLSVLSVLERLPINEEDRKEEISQLKKQYAESQLEDAPDKELVKELVKIIPEISAPKPEISAPKPAETEVVFFGTQRVTQPKRFTSYKIDL